MPFPRMARPATTETPARPERPARKAPALEAWRFIVNRGTVATRRGPAIRRPENARHRGSRTGPRARTTICAPWVPRVRGGRVSPPHSWSASPRTSATRPEPATPRLDSARTRCSPMAPGVAMGMPARMETPALPESVNLERRCSARHRTPATALDSVIPAPELAQPPRFRTVRVATTETAAPCMTAAMEECAVAPLSHVLLRMRAMSPAAAIPRRAPAPIRPRRTGRAATTATPARRARPAPWETAAAGPALSASLRTRATSRDSAIPAPAPVRIRRRPTARPATMATPVP
jgi:hypothetical protein